MSLTAEYRTQLIARLRATTADLAWAARDLPGEQLLWTPNADEWSINEHVAHLVDMEERVYLPLLRWAAIPDMLEPADYSRRVWRDERYDARVSMSDLLEQLNRLRDEEFDVFRELDDNAWLHLRDDGHWGPLNCQWIAEVIYRHALDHLQGVMGLRGDLHLAALDRSVAGGV